MCGLNLSVDTLLILEPSIILSLIITTTSPPTTVPKERFSYKLFFLCHQLKSLSLWALEK